MKAKLLHIDCMEYMKTVADKYFDLAIVDPPYGINVNKMQLGDGRYKDGKKWDAEVPNAEYFNELFRVSKNQIIWGGNYFDLSKTDSWIIWYKRPFLKGFNECEFAWTSLKIPTTLFDYLYCGNCEGTTKTKVDYSKVRIHPTQKPTALYKWIFEQFAKPNDRILDTHLGSGSSAIVAEVMGFDFVGCEIDTEYYNKAVARVKKECDLGLFQMPDEGGQGKPSQKNNTLFDAA